MFLRRKSEHVVYLAVFLAIAASIYKIPGKIYVIYMHRQQCTQMKLVLDRLKYERPVELSKAQWDYILGWTINCYGNCIDNDYTIDQKQLRLLIYECNRIIDGHKVDIHFIDWYWDEVARITQNGKYYSEMYRPTNSESLKTVLYEEFGLGVQ